MQVSDAVSDTENSCGYAFMVGDRSSLHRVAQGSQNGPLLDLAHVLQDWDAFLVGDDPRLSRVDESFQSATSFPESATSFEFCWILLVKCPTLCSVWMC
jgi:hypothetical protein